jgi:hypothetical protein
LSGIFGEEVLRFVLADDGYGLAALQAHLGQPIGQAAHLVQDIAPTEDLPNAARLLAQGEPVAIDVGPFDQKPRKRLAARVKRSNRSRHCALPPR